MLPEAVCAGAAGAQQSCGLRLVEQLSFLCRGGTSPAVVTRRSASPRHLSSGVEQ